jgi:hypothetical protein
MLQDCNMLGEDNSKHARQLGLSRTTLATQEEIQLM